jgi:hypothetical protein
VSPNRQECYTYHLIFQNILYYICWSTSASYLTGTAAADCAAEFCITVGISVGKFTTRMSLSVHIWLEFLESTSSTWRCVITFSSLFYVPRCYFSKPYTLYCYSGVYFLLTSFFSHFFSSFFVLVIHCLVFLVTTFFCCVPLLLWFLHYISSHFLISYIYFCHWLKNDKLRNITSDVRRPSEISLLATLSHCFSVTCPSLVTNIINVSLMSHCFIKALLSYVLA